MNPEITADTAIDELIERFENDIRYDCHQVERRVNFSDARKEMQRRGPKVLMPIAQHLLKSFPGGPFMELDRKHWDLFLAWGYLLFGIMDDHALPLLYKRVKFGEQNMSRWILWCTTNAA